VGRSGNRELRAEPGAAVNRGRDSGFSRVKWEPTNRAGEVGEIWYDLNIDSVASDLTATFRLVRVPGELLVRLDDIHVM
jgi:hypothetical protein